MIGYKLICASINKIINIVKNYPANCYDTVKQINILKIKMYNGSTKKYTSSPRITADV